MAGGKGPLVPYPECKNSERIGENHPDKCPSFVDNFSLGQCCTVAVENPKQCNYSRVGINLAVQVNVRVTNLARARRTRYPRTVCNSVTGALVSTLYRSHNHTITITMRYLYSAPYNIGQRR